MILGSVIKLKSVSEDEKTVTRTYQKVSDSAMDAGILDFADAVQGLQLDPVAGAYKVTTANVEE
jgi:hypothetical protein